MIKATNIKQFMFFSILILSIISVFYFVIVNKDSSYIRFEGNDQSGHHFEFKPSKKDWKLVIENHSHENEILLFVEKHVSNFSQCQKDISVDKVIQYESDGVLIRGTCSEK